MLFFMLDYLVFIFGIFNFYGIFSFIFGCSFFKFILKCLYDMLFNKKWLDGYM